MLKALRILLGAVAATLVVVALQVALQVFVPGSAWDDAGNLDPGRFQKNIGIATGTAKGTCALMAIAWAALFVAVRIVGEYSFHAVLWLCTAGGAVLGGLFLAWVAMPDPERFALQTLVIMSFFTTLGALVGLIFGLLAGVPRVARVKER